MPSIKRKLGDAGEKLSVDFLIKNGYKILGLNYRIKNFGEIDIIAKKNALITFFEVKTRSEKYISDFPIEYSIDKKKRRNLLRICRLYLNEKNIYDTNWQVDAIFIKVNQDGIYTIEHMENVLWGSYY